MWSSRVENLEDGRTRRVSVLLEGRPLPYAGAIERWQHDEAFRTHFISLLAEAPWAAVFWEAPPVTRATLDRDFEFVLVNAPILAHVRAEPEAFAEHFPPAGAGDGVADFWNIGGDALLVAPSPWPTAAYPHLLAFVREAPAEQQHAFWRRVGARVEARVGDRPLWVSTAGTGVYWLHVRLDSRPKYYTHGPYRDGAR